MTTDLSNKSVAITTWHCPIGNNGPHPHRPENAHKRNHLLRRRPDGSYFCPVHGDQADPLADPTISLR